MGKYKRLKPGYTLNEWAWFFAPSAVLLIPFIQFAKSNAYPIWTPEILLIVLALLVAGIVCGILGQIGVVLRALMFAATLTLLLDVQSTWFFDYSLHQYIWIPIGFFVLTLKSPEAIKVFILVTVYATLGAILVTPKSAPIQVRDFGDKLSAQNVPTPRNKPDSIWIHIILDEQIGIESIPAEFDPNRRLADRLRNDYVRNGFTVYGRAFTRFPQTRLSLSNVLNLTQRHPSNFLSSSEGIGVSFSLTQSEYLNRLHQRGYEIHTYYTDYFGICNLSGSNFANSCNKYVANSIWGLNGTSLSTSGKMLLLLKVYSRLSKVYKKLAVAIDIDGRLSVPRSAAPLMSLAVLERFREDVLEANPGSAWLIHLMSPHDPYALRSDCSIRSIPWLENGTDSDLYEMNTVEVRRKIYPHYLEQVECVNQQLQSLFGALRNSGIYDKSHIVVHGDHGSRIATHNLRERPSYRPEFRPSAETMVDYFGTLFAYKPPETQMGEYKREYAPVSDLLERVSEGQLIDKDIDDSDPTAYLVEWNREDCQRDTSDGTDGCRLMPLKMPLFSRGEIGVESNWSSED